MLLTLQNKALELTHGHLGEAVIIFPHGRPARHLIDRIRNNPAITKPCLLPRMHTVQELFALIHSEQAQRPPHMIDLLDRVGLLLECVKSLASPETELLQRLHHGGERHFFPWGVRLAALMEEFFTQGVTPNDLTYMEGHVSPFAATLLESLGQLHSAYTTKLDERGWSTPGFDACKAAQHPEWLPPSIQNRTLLIAGFAALTGTEEAVFKHLWKQGAAHILLYTDPAVASMGKHKVHWTCEDHIKWITSWHAETILACEPSGITPHIDFCEGYDVHSQLHELETILAGADDLSHSAVILPDTGLLMPVLHHLPAKDVNISMGYPLSRSPLFRLLETIMRLQETALTAPQRLYHWRACIDLIRHPYLKMLTIDEERPLADIFHAVEARIRQESRFVDIAALLEEELRAADLTPDALELGHTVLEVCLTLWNAASTPLRVASAMQQLCHILLTHGGDLWQRFPIDAECLYRLMQRVIPALSTSSLAETPFPQDVLFTIVRETIKAERVPFEADPLGGLQVLGMLESRLLHFKRVIVLDATDDVLPGAPKNDPLLPDSLRPLVGLPDSRHRERVAAHNFHRMLAGTEHVTLLWQSGTERSGLLDEKKIRSRFVEELLWHEERKAQRILIPGEAPLRAITCAVRPTTRTLRSIEKTDAIQEQLLHYLEKPLSPSQLDAYIRCPFRFFHQYLCGLMPPDEVMEGDDPAAIGELLHDTLYSVYAPWKGLSVTKKELETSGLAQCFLDKLHQSPLMRQLPIDSLVMLEAAGTLRLQSFVKQQPDRTTIIYLEHTVSAMLQTPMASRRLTGRLDRVDRRDEGDVILDYKSGSVHTIPPSFWEHEELWNGIAQTQQQRFITANDDPLPLLAQTISSVQLPCYLHMYKEAQPESTVYDAALIELRSKGEEHFLLGARLDSSHREAILNNMIPTLLNFIVHHMEASSHFIPHEGKHCDWCSFAKLCKV